MLWAQSRGVICGNIPTRLYVSRIKNGATVRGPTFVDFYVIISLSIIQNNTVPIGISYCFDSPLIVFTLNLSPIE